MRNKILTVLLIAALAFFIFAGWHLFNIYYGYSSADKEYTKLEEKYVSFGKTETVSGSDSSYEKNIEVDFKSLIDINSDTVAWIELPACKISYPVLQASDNQYYLTHTFENKTNHSGAVFLDMYNKADMSDYNSLIYGHNMKNGSMFGRLKKLYQEKDLLDAEPYIYLVLKDNTILQYEIFSYYIGENGSKGYNIPQTEAEFQNYINYCMTNSIEKTGVEVNTDDRILTLATCSGAAGGTKRFFVHAVLISKR